MKEKFSLSQFLCSDDQGENLKNQMFGENEETFGISHGSHHTIMKVSIWQECVEM